MQDVKTASYLQVDLRAIEGNARQIREELGAGTELIPVVKADAYGLGAVKIAQHLSRTGGIRGFAVSHVEEGLALRGAGIEEDVLVMSLPLAFQLADAIEAGLILTLGGFHQFPALREAVRMTGKKARVSLKLDSGLHRIGFLPAEADALCAALRDAADWLCVEGAFSHFSDSEKGLMREEEAVFQAYLKTLRAAGQSLKCCHIASSGSLETGTAYPYDAVRVGRRLFLDNPARPTGRIREAFSLRSCLTDVRERKAGEPLGYGGCVVPERDTRVGVIAIGYGDGLDPALAAARAPVLLNGQRAALLSCCMDQSLIDLGDIPCEPGDEVTLLGYDGAGNLLPSQETAALIGCEGCDLTARLTPRVARLYTV